MTAPFIHGPVKVSNAVAKTIRTVAQVLASGGFLAGINAIVGATGHYLSPNGKAAILAAILPVTVAAHNLLEDHGLIGTWLRRPSLTPAAATKIIAKAAASAQHTTDQLAAEAARLAPVAGPIVDQFKAVLDAAMAEVTARIDVIASQLPTPPAPPVVSVTPVPAPTSTTTVVPDPAAVVINPGAVL